MVISNENRLRHGISNRERVFGFTDEAFREYSTTHSQSKVPIERAYHLYDSMASSSIPIVTYAAGWTLAELCTRDSSKNIISPAWREDALNETERLWDSAFTANAKDFKHAVASGDFEAQQRQFGLGVEMRFSHAHIPAIRAVGRRITTRETSQELLDETYDNLMAFSKWAIGQQDPITKERGPFKNLITGAISETVVSALLHRTNDPDLIVTPASIRQQGLTRAAMRSDLVAHDFSAEEYAKAVIQVKTKKGERAQHYPQTTLIYTQPYLSFKSRGGADNTLAFLLEEFEGKNAKDSNEHSLFLAKSREVDQMSGWLLQKIFDKRIESGKYGVKKKKIKRQG